jgi:hypothetical protein
MSQGFLADYGKPWLKPSNMSCFIDIWEGFIEVPDVRRSMDIAPAEYINYSKPGVRKCYCHLHIGLAKRLLHDCTYIKQRYLPESFVEQDDLINYVIADKIFNDLLTVLLPFHSFPS